MRNRDYNEFRSVTELILLIMVFCFVFRACDYMEIPETEDKLEKCEQSLDLYQRHLDAVIEEKREKCCDTCICTLHNKDISPLLRYDR